VGFVEQLPDLEGRTMLMVLAPGGKKSKATVQPSTPPPAKKPEGGTPEAQPPKPTSSTPA
jgi:hypothetical protein